jgi:hypothetical protein
MSKKQQLRKAFKVLKFWHKVLLSTNLMNELEHRNECSLALKTIKKHSR